jgi:O-antigen ligase
MAPIVVIDIIVVAFIVGVGVTKGIERVLPFVTFVCLLLPGLSRIQLPGLFDLSTQRLVVIVLALLYLIVGRQDTESPRMTKTPLKWLMAAQVVWALISTANSIVPVDSIKKLLAQVFEYYCLYLIYVKTISSVQTIYRILYALVSALFVCSIFGAVEAYTGWSVLSLFPSRGMSQLELALGVTFSTEGRAGSTFPHPILFGAALAVAITLAFHLVSVAESGKRKAFLWVTIVLMFLNLYKTISRGPWLGLIVAFILLLLLNRGKLLRYQLVIVVLAVSVMVIRPGVYHTIRNLYDATFVVDMNSIKGLSAEYRIELTRVAQEALARDFRRELWGYGMGSFVSLNLVGEMAGHQFPFLSCESAWIGFAIETGYVGLALIACLLLTPAFIAWRDFRRLPAPERYLSLILFICMVVYYFMMLSVDMYAWGQEGYMLWILIASSIVYGKLKQPEVEKGSMLAGLGGHRGTERVTTGRN